ncbi:hypothetical protein B0H15DRAFT_953442 [Mycena belliarum]|uniref:Uncharacterized protein n=1 Tax=Mycena belliarum TaxID=1033014 RepID=A0AAD6U0E2_9AGAR|nr:hypothetical protein B0H15DRAFT_953442 [Mycena belliae]
MLLSSAHRTTIEHVLYCDIYVGDRADRLVLTLADQPHLPRLVRSLNFGSSLCARVDMDPWAKVLPFLCNLRHLVIAHHVPLESWLLPSLQLRLLSFTSRGSLSGAWATFISSQTSLRELVCYGDFFATVPGREKLPDLRSITGRTEDVGKFARFYSLEHFSITFGTLTAKDLLRFEVSPARLQTMFPVLRSVMLDQDGNWFPLFKQKSEGKTRLSRYVRGKMAWSGATNGEGPERVWASTTPAQQDYWAHVMRFVTADMHELHRLREELLEDARIRSELRWLYHQQLAAPCSRNPCGMGPSVRRERLDV